MQTTARLTIGSFSALSDVSVKTLRYYDEIGLLRPAYTDPQSGYRYYAAGQLPRLNRILLFKDLGFSLKQIHQLLDKGLPAERLRELLRLRRDELERRLLQERARINQVEVRLRQIEDEDAAATCEVVVKRLAPRTVASLRGVLTSYDEIGGLFDELHSYLKKTRAGNASAAIWHKCEVSQGKIDAEAVVFLKHPIAGNKRISVYELPTNTAACVIHQGADDCAPAVYQAARRWIEANNYQTAGPNREIYLQGRDNPTDELNVTEIQFPIEPAAYSGELADRTNRLT